MKRYIYCFLFACMSTVLNAQSISDIPLIDSNFLPEIGSVHLHPTGNIVGYPIARVDAGRLKLSFDDLSNDNALFTYAIYHCDRNWQLSTEIQEFDYRQGFEEEEIWDFSYSNTPNIQYIHYELIIPNNRMKYLLSGNYILIVYKEVDEKEIAFTRRFMIVDDKVDVTTIINRTVDLGKVNTHQEIDFRVNHEGFTIRNPFTEVYATIYQNGNWNLGYTNIIPIDIQFENLIFNYQNQIVFPGIKEFRHFDMRNLNFRGVNVYDIYKNNDTTQVILNTDIQRKTNYFFYNDLNGKFVHQNLDRFNVNFGDLYGNDSFSTRTLQNIEEQLTMQNKMFSKYCNVHFSLASPRYPNKDIYIIGALSNWGLDEKFKMTYDEKDEVYHQEVLLKQGYYEYVYVTKDRTTGAVSYIDIEGSRFETINDYLIFIYYKPFGTLYDQLIGFFTLEIHKNNLLDKR